ncbi:hypothetical protein MTO96_004650 [Rhipicephalus appendiculatus]
MDSVRRLFLVTLIVCLALTEAAEGQKGKRDEEEQDNPTDQVLKNECWLKPNYHRCKDYVPRWYYDTTYLLCKPYLYGGCGGKNVNAFRSHEECMTRCMFEVPQVGGRSGGQGGRAAQIQARLRHGLCGLATTSLPCCFKFRFPKWEEDPEARGVGSPDSSEAKA